MWQDHVDRYGLRAKVLPISRAIKELPNVPARFRLVLIDESHNLRNREGKQYRAIHEYVAQSESKCILLTATPYNKTYHDLSNQLRLFVPEEHDIGIRPERLLRDVGEVEFIRRHQCPLRSLAAFEKSDYADDWRDLMRLYLVRRTRSFIQENYAKTDPDSGRKYLTFADGTRNYFPVRIPKTAAFAIDDADPDDQYAKLYGPTVVNRITRLELPRYGMANYVAPAPDHPPTAAESRALADLSRAGRRLMGFCRTNLFKRLESSGQAFVQSLERHILRNFVFLHALENDLALPIGTQDAEMLDSRFNESDNEGTTEELFADAAGQPGDAIQTSNLRSEDEFKSRAEEIYDYYDHHFKRRFKWLGAHLFIDQLREDLHSDATELISILDSCGDWNADTDKKVQALCDLILNQHPDDKILIFTQFADTVRYVVAELQRRGVERVAGVTGDVANPTELAWRFSPVSNNKRETIEPESELRVIVATDILSEGHNLQDCSIVVNFDLPWAIIRLIQRAGRVDRIGQKSETIRCYSFLPADGVERIIRLRARVRQRLTENAEVVGTDEQFFEDDQNDQAYRDLFTENAGILDGDDDTEVDLSSYAFQIWKNATDADPDLESKIAHLPPVIFSTKPHETRPLEPLGVLAYLKTGQGNDALVWMDRQGNSVSESQFKILKAAECSVSTPALPRHETHHELVQKAVESVAEEEKSVGGQLGRPSGARFRTYERLKNFADEIQNTLFDSTELRKAVEEIYKFPLRQTAIDILNRQLRSGIGDEDLAALVVALREDNSLCIIQDEQVSSEPRIICSLGLSDN